jgi:hypothetical protein
VASNVVESARCGGGIVGIGLMASAPWRQHAGDALGLTSRKDNDTARARAAQARVPTRHLPQRTRISLVWSVTQGDDQVQGPGRSYRDDNGRFRSGP